MDLELNPLSNLREPFFPPRWFQSECWGLESHTQPLVKKVEGLGQECGDGSLRWFFRKQIHFRKAAVERTDFKVKKEAACSQLQRDGLWFKAILSLSAPWPFGPMLHPPTLVGGVQMSSVRWCLWHTQGLPSHIHDVESVSRHIYTFIFFLSWTW